MIPWYKQSHWLFTLLLIAPATGCESRPRDVPPDKSDRSTVYTRTQGPPPGQTGQGGADSSTPTPAEGGAVGGQGTQSGPGLGRQVEGDNRPQGPQGASPPAEQKGTMNTPTGSQGAMGTPPPTGTRGPQGANPPVGPKGQQGERGVDPPTGTRDQQSTVDTPPPTGSQDTKPRKEPETRKGNPPATGEMGDAAR
jgi:hypothetical protein